MALDPATLAWLATVASRVAASFGTKALAAAARPVRRQFATPEKARALAQCLAAGLAALIEHGYTGDADADRGHLEHVLTTFAAEEAAQDALAGLLAGVLASGATPPDPAPLREVFSELYDPETLPDFDPDRAFAAFVEAFAAQTHQEEALQGTIRTGRIDELVKLARLQVSEIRSLPERIVEEQEKAELRRTEATRDEVRRRYLEHMRRRWRALPLAALGGTEGAGEEVTLDQVFIELDTTTRVALNPSEAEEHRDHPPLEGERWETRTITALDAVRENPHLALLGDPGAGKSALTQELLARIASAQLGEPVKLPQDLPLDLLPVFVRLRDVSRRLGELDPKQRDQESRRKAYAQAVREQAMQSLKEEDLEACTGVVGEAWREGKCFLVLDGLDEVPESRRPQVREAVTAVRRQTRMAGILVTCRVRSYQGEARLPGFEAHTLAPFDEDRIHTFCRAWYRAQAALGRMSGTDAEKKGKDFADAALGEGIFALARNPMLLTTMALIHQKEVGLPRERAKLYDKGVEVLLTRWQRRIDERLVEDEALAGALTDEEKLRRILERLAYEAHQVGGTQKEEAAGLPRGEILVLLARKEYLGDAGLADRFLDYVDQRAGVLVGQGGEPGHPAAYAFPHRTFQEYLAGCYLVGRRERERRYFELAGERDLWSVAALLGAEELLFVRRGTHDVMDLTYALAGECEPSREQERRALLWAGEIAVLVGSGSFERDQGLPGKEDFLDRLRWGLVGLLGSDLPAPERADAGRALGRLGDLRKEVTSCLAMEVCRVPVGDFWWGGDHDYLEVEATPWEKRSEESPYWISRYPVTQAQFAQFAEAGGYREERFWPEARKAGVWGPGKITDFTGDVSVDGPEDYGEVFSLPNHPVVGVTWYEALAFTRWLTEELREQGGPEEWQVRLPSEAEWEKAARGGLDLPAGGPQVQTLQALASKESGNAKAFETIENPKPRRKYPWGDEISVEHANYDDTKIGATTAVGCFPHGISPYGCEEMAGNVWEWCGDVRRGEASERNAAVALRGGSWANPARYLAAAFRNGYGARNRTRSIGFRVVLSSVSEHA